MGFLFNISATAEASDFKFACNWGLLKPIIKLHAEEKGRGRGLGEFPKIWRFPFNICAMTKACNFKFGTQLGYPKAQHKIAQRATSGCGLGLGKLPNIWVPL